MYAVNNDSKKKKRNKYSRPKSKWNETKNVIWWSGPKIYLGIKKHGAPETAIRSKPRTHHTT